MRFASAAPAGSKVEVTAAGRSIRVRDYGPGVPEESLNLIFDPFYGVEHVRTLVSGGAGLGLAIARRAIDLHKGSIRARNANPGLLVEIELPDSVPHHLQQHRQSPPKRINTARRLLPNARLPKWNW